MRNRPRTLTPVAQTTSTDCGPACLSMVLDALGQPRSLSQLRELLDPGRDGTTALDLVSAAHECGLRTRAVRLSPSALSAESLAALPTPFIAHADRNHFVVVEGVRRGKVAIVDPAVGRTTLRDSDVADRLSGIVILFEVTPGLPPRPRPPGVVRAMLLPVLTGHRRVLAVVGALSVLLTVLGLTVPLATARVTDTILRGNGFDDRWALAIAATVVLVAALSIARGRAVVLVQSQLSRHLSTNTVRTLLAAEYRYFERRSVGDLINRISSVTVIREIVATVIISALLDAVLATSYLAIVITLEPALGAAAAAAFVVQVALVVALTARARRHQREELTAQSDAAGRLVDTLHGMATIRVNAAEMSAMQEWAADRDREIDAAARRGRLASYVDAIVAGGRIGIPVAFLVLAASTSPEHPGTVLGLAALVAAALAPAASLSSRLFALSEMKPILERLSDIAEARPEQSPGEPGAVVGLSGAVTLRDVGFRYDRNAPHAVRDVNIAIPAGSKVAIVGTTASGKSTLVKLLAGLHRPTEGSVEFDGVDIATLDLAALRRRLGVVLQESHLRGGTIRQAITLGRPEASDADVERAARLAAIHDEIAAMPMGYDTPLSAGGIGLSGGQRQRVALAAALVKDPVVLILDEASSALDTVTESTIQRNLESLAMTRIVIAHRLSTIADADQVVVMEHGQIVERGSPEELLSTGGRYAALVAAQVPSAAVR